MAKEYEILKDGEETIVRIFVGRCVYLYSLEDGNQLRIYSVYPVDNLDGSEVGIPQRQLVRVLREVANKLKIPVPEFAKRKKPRRRSSKPRS